VEIFKHAPAAESLLFGELVGGLLFEVSAEAPPRIIANDRNLYDFFILISD